VVELRSHEAALVSPFISLTSLSLLCFFYLFVNIVLIRVMLVSFSNASIFPEFIIPSIKHLVHSGSVGVVCISAVREWVGRYRVQYLEMGP